MFHGFKPYGLNTRQKKLYASADDLYFEFNSRAITNDLDGMIKGYERIKAKEKIVIIGDLDKIRFQFVDDAITEVFIECKVTSIEKDDIKKVNKATMTFFIKNDKIFKYIENFDH